MSVNCSLWDRLRPGDEITIVKTHYGQHRPDYSYPAGVIESDHPGWFAFEATWALPDMNVDGILYEKGGTLLEYFSPQQFFNVFHVFRRGGESAGLYANVTELPILNRDVQDKLTLTWTDCWLDVIRLPGGDIQLLDEDELEASGVEQTNPELTRRIRAAACTAAEVLSSDEWTV